MKKLVYGLIFTVLMSAIYPAFVYADKVLFFTPTRVLLNDQDKVQVMNITNLSNISRAYKISFQDQIMTPQGFTTPVDSFEYSAKRMLRFVPREFVLNPGDRQTIRIMSRLRPDTAPGEYHTHIRFLEDVSQRNDINPPKDKQAATIAAPLAYEALIPAIVSHGAIDVSVDLKDAQITKNEKNSEYKLKTILTRQGNGQGIAYVGTYYVAPDGTRTMVTPRRTVYIYRELDERSKDYDFVLSDDLPRGGNIVVSLYDSTEKDAKAVKALTLPLP